MKNILVTCGLPYANGPIHLGHILEQIQADIWVRYQKLIGNKVYFICADDAHGTAIMLNAKKLNILPELMIKNILKDHKKQFINFNISHNLFYTTHSNLNYFYSLMLLNNLYKNKLLYKKKDFQYFDIKKNIFLPDRLLLGTCPRCGEKNQYGDVCENCHRIYNSYELINPISVLSNSTPILKKTENLFINIKKYKKILYYWIISINLQKEVKNQLLFWLENNLNIWSISRESPYFGFKIPNKYINNKYFYVWLDAPLGYLSVFKYFCNNNNLNLFDKFWNINSNYEVYHFIGKDILYFHGLLWPIMLENLNFRKPTNIIVHGHLKINGIKMSKSKNNFITSEKWLKYLDSDSLRYYFASKLSFNIKDINLCLNDYIKKINCDLINKYINIISRIYPFLEKYYNNLLSNKLLDENFYYFFVNKSNIINNYYINYDYFLILLEVTKYSNIINKYINNYKPWHICKIIKKKKELHNFCTTIVNIFSVISIYLSPIIPNIFNKIEDFLNIKLYWKKKHIPILNHRICKYKKIYKYLNKDIFLNF